MEQGTRRHFITKVGMGVGAMGLIAQAPSALADPGPSAPAQNAPAAPVINHVQHLRKDGGELGQMGNGDIAKGMNKLGEQGYQLHSVTTITNTGEGGYHLFKRQPWDPTNPGTAPQYQMRLISDFDLGRLAQGDFNKGIQTLEKDGWEIVTYTELPNGSVAYYYLQRVKP